MKSNQSQCKKESKALSSYFLETRSIPDKDTKCREKVSGSFTLNCGNHAGTLNKLCEKFSFDYSKYQNSRTESKVIKIIGLN